MTKTFNKFALSAAALLASGSALAATGAVADEFKWMTFAVFGVIIAITMGVTYWAAQHTHTTSEFYAAGRSVTGIQNGWAIAGDYLSAASFLGIAGLISLYGYDGFMYSVGWLVAYITVLLVIAEPCRNIGKYTMGDILAFRNDPKKVQDRGGAVHHHRVHLLPDRADGRRRRADQDPDRHRLRNLRDRRRHPDAGLRRVRRHEGHHLGADHQGRAAGDRVHPAGVARLGALRLQPAGLPASGGRATRRCRRRSPSCWATRPPP